MRVAQSRVPRRSSRSPRYSYRPRRGRAGQGRSSIRPELPIPGATVELLSAAHASVAKVVSAADGAFRFADVAAGNYEIRVTLAGFRADRGRPSRSARPTPAPLRVDAADRQRQRDGDRRAGSTSLDAVDVGAGGASPAAGAASSRRPGGVRSAGRAADVGAGGGRRRRPGVRQRPRRADVRTSRPIPRPTRRSTRTSSAALTDQPLSTFSIDVDTASYANVRRFLNEGRLPPADAVRVEELINYFQFDYADSTQGAPVRRHDRARAVPVEQPAQARADRPAGAGGCRQGKTPPRNLVFLLDVSGSMTPARQAAAGEDRDEDARRNARRRRIASRSSPTRARPASRCRRRAAIAPATIQDAIARARRRRLDQRRRRHPARLPDRQPRTSSRAASTASSSRPTATSTSASPAIDDADAADRREARRPACSCPCSASAPATSRTRRWRSSRTRGTATTRTSIRCTEARRVLVAEAGSTLVTVAKDVKIQVEFNPALRRRLPPGRLREPQAARAATSTTTRRTPARWAPATP